MVLSKSFEGAGSLGPPVLSQVLVLITLLNCSLLQGLEEKLKHIEAEKSSLASNLEDMRNTSMDSNTQVEKMTAEVKDKSAEISGLQGSSIHALYNVAG